MVGVGNVLNRRASLRQIATHYRTSMFALLMVSVVSLALLSGMQPAGAALWLKFDPPRAPFGMTVNATTVGSGAFRPIPGPDNFPTVYMVADARRLLLGRLQVDATGNGSLMFRVPDVAPGRHEVVADCPTCSPQANSLLVGQFEVLAADTTTPGVGASPPNERGNEPDPVARWIAIAAVTLAALSLGRQFFADWRKRHRVTSELRTAVQATRNEQFDLILLTVRSLGRPMAVEDIVVEWTDERPQPKGFGWHPIQFSGEYPPFGLGAPALPFVLADGEARVWAYQVTADEDAFDPTKDPVTDTRRLRAAVRLANNRVVRSNEAHVRLRPLPPPETEPVAALDD